MSNRLVIVWLAIVLVGGAVLYSWDLPKIYRLSLHSTQTTAQVTGKACLSHGAAPYEYYVHGVRHTGSDAPPFPCGESAVGRKFAVYYNPDEPDISGVGNPRYGMLKVIALFAYVVIVGSSIFVWRSRLRMRTP